MTFIAGFALGVLATMGFAFITTASDADDVIDKEYNKD
jgi:hypothetical protein